MKITLTIPQKQIPGLQEITGATGLSAEQVLRAGLQTLINSKDDAEVMEAITTEAPR